MAPMGTMQLVARCVLSAGLKRLWCRSLHRGSTLLYETPPRKPVATVSYVHGTCNVPLTCRTMQQCLWETTERIPEEEALVVVHSNTRKTFSQLTKDIETLAAGLLALGLKKGDRLGMWGPNSYEWILVQYATALAGIILVSVNPAYQARELEYSLKKVGCCALVFPDQFKTQNYYEILRSICPEIDSSPAGGIKSKALPDLRIAIVLDKKYPGAFQFQEVMEAGDTQHVKQMQDLQKSLSCDDPINIQFTSGTTGYPKGVTLSHHNIVNNAYLFGIRLGYDWRKGIRAALPAPLYHCLGSVIGSLTMVVHGTTLVLTSPSFEAQAVVEAIRKEKCTLFYGTPTMYINMMAVQNFASHTSTLTSGLTGGAPVSHDLFKKIVNETTIKNLLVCYGSTENSPVVSMQFFYDDSFRIMNTVGCIMPHTEAKVVDTDTDQIVPLNTPGELLVRGYCIMLGYWNDEEKTKEVINQAQWYKTGDIATMDEFGYFRIVGRSKDMIIRGGENIYPAEIEQFLHAHPKIQEVEVIGVRDYRMGEEVCAAIRIHDGEQCTAEEIKQYCKGKISHFKIPRYIIFVDSYPLTVSGKIQKFKLKEIIEKQLNL
ncbi:medium-chain acyl-CoA ligase ACSF2, mitochondrial-like [Gastrophryne carolinensis]